MRDYYDTFANNAFPREAFYAFALLTALLWTEQLRQFRACGVVGPLLGVFSSMGRDFGQFLVLMAGVLLAFASVGLILLPIPEFATLHEALLTLFSWLHGDFDVGTVRPAGVPGVLFQAAFLGLCSVLLLNLLIAIFSATYAIHDRVARGLHFRTLLYLRPRWAPPAHLNALSFRVPPLSAFTLPLVLCAPRCLEACLYLPVFLTTLLVLLPALHCLAAIPAIFALCSRARHSRRSACLLLLFPLLFFALLFYDLPRSAKRLWTAPAPPSSQPLAFNPFLSSSDLATLKKVLHSFPTTKHNNSVPLGQVLCSLRD